MSRFLLLALVLAAGRAMAEPVVSAAAEPPPPQEPTAVEPVALPAPLPPAVPPDKASGIAVDDELTDNERERTVSRALLFLPKMVFWAAVQPVRGVVYVYERYDLRDKFVDATFTDDKRFGVYPVAGYESSYGFTIGARVLAKDIFGEGERVKLRADYGGEFRYAVGVGGNTGTRFGRLRFDFDSSLERRTREKFYGIGNDRKEIATPLEMPLDPTITDVGLQSRFGQDVVRNVVGVKVRFTPELTTRLSGAWMMREFSGSDKDDITVRYDTSKLVGWDSGLNNVYVENEVAYDSRRPATQYATQTLDGTGWLVRAHGGVGRGLETDTTSYIRYGGEVQRYFDLYQGTRTLSLRLLADAVTGTDGRTDGKISFVDLPRLGGSEFLRGYPTGRFRDRAVMLATAEYTWPLMNNAAAFTFIDVGRPLDSLDEAGKDLDRLRFGYGVGIQVHTRNTYLMRTQLAFSREGDFTLNFVFSPAFGRRERAGRF